MVEPLISHGSTFPGPVSLALERRRSAAVAAGVSSVAPIYVSRASGAVLVDVDGREYIDLTSGIAVASAGHVPGAVVAAVREQLDSLLHSCFMVAPYESYVAVCERLTALTPGAFPKKAILVNSGAEAVENAVKIARHATGRPAVVVFENAYHGRTNLTMAMTAKVMPYKDGFGPFASEIYRAPGSYPFREPIPVSGEAAAQRAIDFVVRHVGVRNVACVVIEPIQGEGGFIVPASGFLKTLADWCRDSGILFVADEIQTGLARTGAMFACEHEDVVPDITVVGKALASGLPLAGVVGRAEIMDHVHPGGLGGTFGGNPVSCAAAIATLQLVEELDLCAKARAIEQQVVPRLQALATRCAFIGDVRGRGAMLALELTHPGTKEPAPGLTARVVRACYERGVAVLSCGMYGNVIRLLPPLVIESKLLDEALAVLEDVVAESARNGETLYD